MGARIYRATDEPREIIQKLRDTYGKPTPAKKSANEANFAAPWNPSEPIEELYDRLEDCYLTAMLAKPAFTIDQMIDRALRAIQQTGLYTTAVLEWNGFDLANKTWPQFKEHFAEAYEIRCATGAGTAAAHGYANNTIDDDDDSIDTIKDSLNNIQLANNTNAQTMSDNISAITHETSALRAALAQTQQQLAMLAQTQQYSAPFQWPQYPAVQPPVQPAMQPPIQHLTMPTAPQQQAYAAAAVPPPQYQQQAIGYNNQRGNNNRNRNNKGNGGRGRGRGNNNRRNNGAYGPQPPQQQMQSINGIPPPAYGNTNNNSTQGLYSNTVKHFNNWNMCFSCGWDVPIWHTSATCPTNCRKNGHQEQVDRNNAEAYINAGHNVCKKGKHKNTLPTNPGPQQA